MRWDIFHPFGRVKQALERDFWDRPGEIRAKSFKSLKNLEPGEKKQRKIKGLGWVNAKLTLPIG